MGAGALTSNKLSHLQSLPRDEAVKIIVQSGVKRADAEVVISRVCALASTRLIDGSVIASLVEGLPPETQDALVALTLRSQSRSTFAPSLSPLPKRITAKNWSLATKKMGPGVVVPEDMALGVSPLCQEGYKDGDVNVARPAPSTMYPGEPVSHDGTVWDLGQGQNSSGSTSSVEGILGDGWVLARESPWHPKLVETAAPIDEPLTCNYESLGFALHPHGETEETSVLDGHQQSLVFPRPLVPQHEARVGANLFLNMALAPPLDLATVSSSKQSDKQARTLSSWEQGPLPEPSESRADSRVQPGRWKPGKLIGSGSFGQVFQGLNLDTGAIIAIKTIFLPASSGGETAIKELKQIRTEIELMSTLSHPNVVRYLGVEVDHEACRLYIFQEWVAGGSLSSVLKTFGGSTGAFDDVVTRKYLRDCLSGLVYLHDHRIVHRDLKGENVLISDVGVAKLADMGASKRISPDGTMNDVTQIRGTLWYMSPQQLKQQRVGRKTDVWALGGLALLMATGDPPWKALKINSPYALMTAIISAASGPPLDSYKLSADLRAFIDACFTYDDYQRPSAREIAQHRFLQQSTPPSIESPNFARILPDASLGTPVA